VSTRIPSHGTLGLITQIDIFGGCLNRGKVLALLTRQNLEL